MKKQLIRLTEEDLTKIIESTVNRIITENEENEGFWNSLKSFGGQYAKKGATTAQNFGNKMGTKMRQGYDNVKQNVQNASANMKQGYNNMKQDVQNTWQGAKRDGSMSDMLKAFNNFKAALEKFRQSGGQINPQLNSRVAGIEKFLKAYQSNY